jgi:hypothetical protein
MIYLYSYLAAGVVIMLIQQAALRFAKKGKQEFPELLGAAGLAATPARLPQKLLQALLTTLVLVVACALWPLFLALLLQERWGLRKEPDAGFAVRPCDLVQRLALAEIEAREQVTDPLGAVPALPFGHLHAAWQAFLNGQDELIELWSFASTADNEWGDPVYREGYVVVQDGSPSRYFITVLN